MKTAGEYRAMAEECFKWAREARTKEVRKSYLQLAQIWLNTASQIDGLPATRTPAQVQPNRRISSPSASTTRKSSSHDLKRRAVSFRSVPLLPPLSADIGGSPVRPPWPAARVTNRGIP